MAWCCRQGAGPGVLGGLRAGRSGRRGEGRHEVQRGTRRARCAWASWSGCSLQPRPRRSSSAPKSRASSRTRAGAVVPGVTVTATNMATQSPSVTVTDGTGFFVFPNLTPGRYEVSAELEGFKKAVVTDLQLDASAKISRSFTLETGGLTETVTVTSEATPMATDTTMRKTVEAKDIEVLSFNGRNPIGVAGLKPGVLGGSFNNRGFGDLSNGGYNINGSRPDENNITIDGATAIRTRSAGHDHRHPERRRHPGSPGADGQLHAGVRARLRRPDPVRHQERQQPVSRAARRSSTRTTSCRPTPGRATAARARSRTAVRRRSTRSSTATPSAARSRA